MIGKEMEQRSRLKSYVIAFLVTLLFWSAIYGIIIIVARFHLIPTGFLFSLLLFFLPLSPFFIVWLYFMYKALVPVTGGMPAKGFRQWALAYAWGLGLLLYWGLWAFIFDMTIPFLEVDYREAILPLIILIVTQLLLARSARYQQFMNRIFKTNGGKESKRTQ
jgi:hypothetical protein